MNLFVLNDPLYILSIDKSGKTVSNISPSLLDSSVLLSNGYKLDETLIFYLGKLGDFSTNVYKTRTSS